MERIFHLLLNDDKERNQPNLVGVFLVDWNERASYDGPLGRVPSLCDTLFSVRAEVKPWLVSWVGR